MAGRYRRIRGRVQRGSKVAPTLFSGPAAFGSLPSENRRPWQTGLRYHLSSTAACCNYLSLMTLLETYLRELRDIRSTGAGVEEESYYHPLATLLSEVGKKLKPKVKCVLQLANRAAGKPGKHIPERIHPRMTKSPPVPCEARLVILSGFLRLAPGSIKRFQPSCCLDRQRATLLLYAPQSRVSIFEQGLRLGIAPLNS